MFDSRRILLFTVGFKSSGRKIQTTQQRTRRRIIVESKGNRVYFIVTNELCHDQILQNYSVHNELALLTNATHSDADHWSTENRSIDHTSRPTQQTLPCQQHKPNDIDCLDMDDTQPMSFQVDFIVVVLNRVKSMICQIDF
jgi:hypothetical protein